MGVNARRGVDRRAKKRALFAVPIGFFGIVLLTLVGVKGQGTAWAAANGAHAKHSAYPCQSCHVWHLGPSNWFEKDGLAYIKPSDSNPSPSSSHLRRRDADLLERGLPQRSRGDVLVHRPG